VGALGDAAGRAAMLARIEPEKPGHELRTFECPRCDNSESIVAKI